METKSRYEVASELLEKKRQLLGARDSYEDNLFNFKRKVTQVMRQIEDNEEELLNTAKSRTGVIKRLKQRNKTLRRELDDVLAEKKLFEDTADQKKQTINDMIKSIDVVIDKFQLNSQSLKT